MAPSNKERFSPCFLSFAFSKRVAGTWCSRLEVCSTFVAAPNVVPFVAATHRQPFQWVYITFRLHKKQSKLTQYASWNAWVPRCFDSRILMRRPANKSCLRVLRINRHITILDATMGQTDCCLHTGRLVVRPDVSEKQKAYHLSMFMEPGCYIVPRLLWLSYTLS